MFLFRRSLGGLRPADEDAEAEFARIKPGQEVLIHVHRARNPRHHNLAFKMFELCASNSERWADKDEFRAWLLVQTGHCKTYPVEGSDYAIKIPHSMKFESMSQDDFQDFWNKALTVIEREFDRDMVAEVNRLIGIDYGEAA